MGQLSSPVFSQLQGLEGHNQDGELVTVELSRTLCVFLPHSLEDRNFTQMVNNVQGMVCFPERGDENVKRTTSIPKLFLGRSWAVFAP